MLFSALIYAGSLNGALVWDDRMIVSGEAIGGGDSLLHCFTQPFLNHFFRPLVSVSFYLERMLWHNNPLGYHVTNLLIHVLTVGALMALLHSAFGKRSVALIGGLLFSVQPAQVGTVAWIGGRTDSMALLWISLFAWTLVEAAKSSSRRGLLLLASLIAFNLALYTKEQSLALLPLVPLAFHFWKSDRDSPKNVWLPTFAFAACAVLFLVIGRQFGLPHPSPLSHTPMEIAAQAGRTIAYYALLLIVPTPRWMHTLSLNVLEQSGWWPVALGYLVLGSVLWLIVRWWKRAPAAAWFMAFTILALLPVSNFLPLTFLVAAPYRAAIAGFGLAGVLGWAFSTAIEKIRSASFHSHTPTLPYSSLALILVWQGGLSVWGAAQWRSESRIFHRFVQYDPDNIVANYIYSFTFDKENSYQQSAELKERALTLIFGSEAWRNGPEAALTMQNDPLVRRRAMQNQGTDRDPLYWIVSLYADAGNMWLKAERMDLALALYHAGESLRPYDAGINVGLGYCAGQSGNSAEEIRRMRIALQADPTRTYAHTRLGYAYGKLGQWSAARDEFAIWLKAEPKSEEARKALEEAKKHLN